MWFRRLLLSYLPVFCIVTMILFVVFFSTLSEQSRREAVKANDFLAQQVILFTDNALRSIDHQVVREILTSPDVSRFFDRDYVDVLSNIQALNVMDELKFNYPIIDSVYFYRFSDQFVFGDAPRSFEEFQDAAFLTQYEQRESKEKWTGTRSYKTFYNSQAVDVITLVREAPYGVSDKQGYFVVNVSLSKLQQSVDQMYNSDISFVRMTDKAGGSVLGGADESGKNAILAEYTSPYTGWEIASGIVDKNGLKLALTFYNVWIVFAVAVVVVGLLWVFYVTKRNYRPIQQLVSLIETYSLTGKKEAPVKEGEFGFIQNTLESLMSQTKHFQQQYREKLIFQKKYQFQQVLQGSVLLTEEEWADELRHYELEVEGKTAIVHMIEIDGYEGFMASYSPRDQSLLKFTLYSVIHETAKTLSVPLWAEWTTERRVSLIMWLPDPPDGAHAEGRETETAILQACRLWIEANVSFTITIGQGKPARSLEELRQSYELAEYGLEFKAVLGSNRMIATGDTLRPESERQEYFKTIYMLSQALRLADQEWSAHLGFFFGQIREALLPRREIESLLQFGVHHLEGTMLELSREYRTIWRDARSGLLALTRCWDTLEELEQGCTELFGAMTASMQAQRDSSSGKALINEIRAFIEENYANSELSLDFLSHKFQLNPKYLSKMFKDEFGENFVDFLIGLRIKYAKQMLQETQKSMQSISSEVGYYNYNSFNRAFKNVVGLSPRDFRKQVSIIG